MASSHEKARGATPRPNFQTFNKAKVNTPRAAIKAAILRNLPDDGLDDLGGWVQLGSPVDAVLAKIRAKMIKRGGHDPH